MYWPLYSERLGDAATGHLVVIGGKMSSATSCIPPITTRCPVQPAASLQSLPDVQCNQLHPSNHYQMSSATSGIPPITTRWPVHAASCTVVIEEMQLNSLATISLTTKMTEIITGTGGLLTCSSVQLTYLITVGEVLPL